MKYCLGKYICRYDPNLHNVFNIAIARKLVAVNQPFTRWFRLSGGFLNCLFVFSVLSFVILDHTVAL